MIEIFRMLYQILLELAMIYIAVCYPERKSILVVLCTWLVVSVIRERRE